MSVTDESAEGEPSPERRQLWSRATVEAVVNVGGATAGMATAGPAGMLVASLLTPMTMALWDDFGGRLFAHRKERALQTLASAAVEMGITVDGVIEAASDPQRELLLGQAVIAAGNTAFDAKVVALGRALAAGLTADDDHAVDESAQIVAAIADLEAPHVRLLATYFTHRKQRRWPEGDNGEQRQGPAYVGRKVSRRGPNGQFSSYRVGIAGLHATLERHGLIELEPIDRSLEKAFTAFRSHVLSGSASKWQSMPQDVRSLRQTWRGTALGAAVLDLIRSSAPDGDLEEDGPTVIET